MARAGRIPAELICRFQGMAAPRRGWRERIDKGLYRAHRTGCPSSADRKPGRRCRCAFELSVPASEPGRTRTVTVKGTVSEARAERRRLMAEGREAVAPARSGAPPLREWAARWMRNGQRTWAPATIDSRDRAYRMRIDARFGETPIDRISRADIESWFEELLVRGDGPRSVQLALEALRAMLGVALDEERVGVNPAAGLRVPQARTGGRQVSDRVLGPEGLARLIEACRNLYEETVVRAASEGGLRRGEIVGLKWPDVRLEERRLLIRSQVYQDSRVGKIEKSTKGLIGRVAISPTFAARLADYYVSTVVEGGGDASSWVWPGRKRGQPMSPSSITHLIGKLGVRAGLVDDQGRHIAHLHGLRHSAGSIALSEGVPLTIVSGSFVTAASTRRRAPTSTCSATINSTGLPPRTTRRAGSLSMPRDPPGRRTTPRQPRQKTTSKLYCRGLAS